MAGIVKKIGKITKYETTDYVGTARMLDLDRAAADSHDAIPVEPVAARRQPDRRVHRGRRRGRERRRCRDTPSLGDLARSRRARASAGSKLMTSCHRRDQLPRSEQLAAELPFARRASSVVVERCARRARRSCCPAARSPIRVLDLRNREPARAYVRGAPLRDGVIDEPSPSREAAIERGTAQERGRRERPARRARALGLAVHRHRDRASRSRSRPAASSTACSTSATRPGRTAATPTRRRCTSIAIGPVDRAAHAPAAGGRDRPARLPGAPARQRERADPRHRSQLAHHRVQPRAARAHRRHARRRARPRRPRLHLERSAPAS